MSLKHLFLISILIFGGMHVSASASQDFVPLGSTFTDATFGATIRRLTDVSLGVGSSLIYGINGLWNANETLYAHNIDAHGTVNIINTKTGQAVRRAVPFSAKGDSVFDPVNP